MLSSLGSDTASQPYNEQSKKLKLAKQRIIELLQFSYFGLEIEELKESYHVIFKDIAIPESVGFSTMEEMLLSMRDAVEVKVEKFNRCLWLVSLKSGQKSECMIEFIVLCLSCRNLSIVLLSLLLL